MSRVDRCSYSLFEESNEGRERFVGSAFTLRSGDKLLMVTAAHVAFDNAIKPRQLIARQFTGNLLINGLNFHQHGYSDIASAEICAQEETLELGLSDTIIYNREIRIRPIFIRGRRTEFPVNVIQIGGIPICRRGDKRLDPRYDRTFSYVSKDGSQPAWPGCSGSPLVDTNEKVVGVHVNGHWENGGIRINGAVIFTSDHK